MAAEVDTKHRICELRGRRGARGGRKEGSEKAGNKIWKNEHNISKVGEKNKA